MSISSHTSLDILKKYWGYDEFRPPQGQIIDSVLEGNDTFVLMPTGGGKSLCYQVPAVIMDGVTLVITPLIALMKDQVANLEKRGIQARAIYSGMYKDEIEDILNRAVNKRISLLYLSPERLSSPLFKSYLEDMPVSLVAVDEAHCISQWGYDFRPAYLDIAQVREYTEAPMLALTGSADPIVIEDIITRLDFKSGYQIFKKSFARENLCYRIKYSQQKTKCIAEDYKQKFSAIVYAGTRGNTEKTCSRLRQKGISADFYHAGLTGKERQIKQDNWMKESPPMMICTNAFGMGIDKPNVRQVFHTLIPSSPEAYYQEAGRAGRDGKFSTATLIFSERDLDYLDLQIRQNRFSYEEAQHMYDQVHASYSIPYNAGAYEYFSIDEVMLAKKLDFNIYKVLSFLKFFHQEGFWEYKDSEWDIRPSVKAYKLPNGNSDPTSADHNSQKVLSALFRLYQNIRYNFQKINIEHLSMVSELSQETVLQSLKYLNQEKCIDLRIPTEGSSLLLLRDRVPSSELTYNQSKLKKLKEKDELKANQMKSYVKNRTICRPKMLISFFGEEVEKDCGICDVCQRNKGKISKDKLCTFVRSQEKPHIKALQEKFFTEDREDFLNWLRLGIQLRWWEISSTGNIKLLIK